MAAAENAGSALRDAYHQAPRDTVSQAVYNGWKQFNLNCARCHGEDVSGTTIAPHLIVSLKPDGPINTKEIFVQTVCAGRPAKGMPAWCALGLEMDKINDIYQYVKGRSDAKISPGRPGGKKDRRMPRRARPVPTLASVATSLAAPGPSSTAPRPARPASAA